MKFLKANVHPSLPLCVSVVMLSCAVAWAVEQGTKMEFSRTTVDVGIVVSDEQKAIDFYTKVLGFTAEGQFDVPASLGRDAGLADGHPFRVHVMMLGGDKTATKIKLMQFQDAPGKKQDNSYIHSTLGPSYLTIGVSDIDAAVAHAAKQGVKPLAKGPVLISGGRYIACLRDPDGNIIELVGPKR